MDGLPAPFDALEANLTDVGRLIAIHTKLTGEKRGRRFDVDVLNKSGIVLTVACWEAFVEDSASAAYAFLIAHAKEPQAFPSKVLALAAAPLRQAKDDREVYRLAGEGWRAVLQEHSQRVLSSFLDGFNTPRPVNVDRLFEELIGLKAVSQQWRWLRNPNAEVLRRLDFLIRLRGDIAHRVSVNRYVTKREVFEATDLVRNMAVITANRVRDHVHAQTGVHPWAHLKVGSAE